MKNRRLQYIKRGEYIKGLITKLLLIKDENNQYLNLFDEETLLFYISDEEIIRLTEKYCR